MNGIKFIVLLTTLFTQLCYGQVLGKISIEVDSIGGLFSSLQQIAKECRVTTDSFHSEKGDDQQNYYFLYNVPRDEAVYFVNKISGLGKLCHSTYGVSIDTSGLDSNVLKLESYENKLESMLKKRRYNKEVASLLVLQIDQLKKKIIDSENSLFGDDSSDVKILLTVSKTPYTVSSSNDSVYLSKWLLKLIIYTLLVVLVISILIVIWNKWIRT